MSATTQASLPSEQTEHPHVVRTVDVLGGEPRVVGSRVPVRQVLQLSEAGLRAEEIAAEYPPLTLGQVYDALSYAYDHPEEIAHYEERQNIRAVMRRQDLVLVGHRLMPRNRLEPGTILSDTPFYTWETLPSDREG